MKLTIRLQEGDRTTRITADVSARYDEAVVDAVAVLRAAMLGAWGFDRAEYWPDVDEVAVELGQPTMAADDSGIVEATKFIVGDTVVAAEDIETTGLAGGGTVKVPKGTKGVVKRCGTDPYVGLFYHVQFADGTNCCVLERELAS